MMRGISVHGTCGEVVKQRLEILRHDAEYFDTSSFIFAKSYAEKVQKNPWIKQLDAMEKRIACETHLVSQQRHGKAIFLGVIEHDIAQCVDSWLFLHITWSRRCCRCVRLSHATHPKICQPDLISTLKRKDDDADPSGHELEHITMYASLTRSSRRNMERRCNRLSKSSNATKRGRTARPDSFYSNSLTRSEMITRMFLPRARNCPLYSFKYRCDIVGTCLNTFIQILLRK